MKTVIKTSIGRLFLRSAFILSPGAWLVCASAEDQAVSPAPDGGYPGNNTAEGQNALLSLHTGSTNNTAVDWSSLKSGATGTNNTAIGAGHSLPIQQTEIRPLVPGRFSTIPPARATRPLVLLRSITTPPATKTRPPVVLRFLVTPPATTTRPSVVTRSLATPPASKTRPPVFLRSLATPPATSTRLLALSRSSSILQATQHSHRCEALARNTTASDNTATG